MSKYIKIKDALNVCRLKPIIENGTTTGVGYPTSEEIISALSYLPTIEVSEDCISRAELIKSFLDDNECKREEAKACMCSLDLMLELIEDAPSVVPTTEQSSMVDIVTCEECKRCKKGLVIERRADGQENIVNLCNRTKPPTMVSLDFYCKYGERIEE